MIYGDFFRDISLAKKFPHGGESPRTISRRKFQKRKYFSARLAFLRIMCYNNKVYIVGSCVYCYPQQNQMTIQVKTMSKIRILGVDPGYAIVGFGILDYDGLRFTPVEYGAVLTEAHTPFPERLKAIHTDIEFIFGKYSPDCMAVEKLFFTTNQKTAIDVAQARGVTVLSAADRGIPVFEYTPLQVKSAVVGYGKAEKQQVMEMTRQLLGLAQIPKPDDAADALAVAICHGHSTRWG